MWEQDKLPSGTNDESRSSGINDEENEDDLSDDSSEDEESEKDEDQEDDQDQDDDKELDRSWKPMSKWEKHRLYAITNLQNRKIADLKKELWQLKNSKNLSEDDLAKIRDKYDEEDLGIIEKIIEKKAGEMMDKRQTTSLAQRELNIFLKEHPDLSDPEVRHIRALQKDYWYSLKKAYNMLFGNNRNSDENKPKPKHSVWDSFWWDNPQWSSKNDSTKENEKAYKDMDTYL